MSATNTNSYVCGIDADGKLSASFILYKNSDIESLTKKIKEIDENLSVFQLDSETYNMLIGNREKQYRYIDGKAVEYTPPEPTAEERQAAALAELDSEYQAKFDELDEQIMKAAALKNTEMQDALINDRTALAAEYAEKRGNL